MRVSPFPIIWRRKKSGAIEIFWVLVLKQSREYKGSHLFGWEGKEKERKVTVETNENIWASLSQDNSQIVILSVKGEASLLKEKEMLGWSATNAA